MSETTANDQTETDDWAAAMAEQAASSHNDSAGQETEVDDWAAAMAEQSASDQGSPAATEKHGTPVMGAQTASASVFQEF